jgi:hypothetical protein
VNQAVIIYENTNGGVNLNYRRFQFGVFLLSLIFLLARTPVWNMVWDADGYFNSSIAIATGTFDANKFIYRGVLTSLVYVIPSFVGLRFLEPTVFGTYLYVLVLFQNALIVSLVGSYIIPRLLELFIPRSKSALIASSLISVYAFQSFVPYSLIDVFAVALLIPSIYLMNSQRNIVALIYGLILGVSVNLRPSYLATAIFLVLCAAVIQRHRSLIFYTGLIISQLPQVIFNWLHFQSFSFFALASGKFASSNYNLAAYAIRVDSRTYPQLGKSEPLLFCDKRMFDLAKQSNLTSTIDMLVMFVKNPIATFVFEVKKISSAVWWPVTVPYYDHNPLVNTVFGAVIALVVVLGTSMLILLVMKSTTKKNFLGFVAVYFGFFVNIIVYHNEPRYALPVVVVSIVGFVLLCTKLLNLPLAGALPELTRNWKVATAVVYLVVVLSAILVLVGDRGFASLSACGPFPDLSF